MSVLPSKLADRIKFCQEHIPVWSLVADQIGTTTAAVTALGTKTTAVQAAVLDQGEKQQAAQAATGAVHQAADAMVGAVSDILKQIKAQAAITGDSVYTLAEIPAPALPGPRPAPGTPIGLKVTLDGSGILNLKWKCPNPPGTSGTIYQIWRRTGPTAEFTYLGSSGSKTFVDSTLPAGATQVTYQIQAQRSTVAGPWAQFNVNFGVAAGGAAVASVSTPRMAA